MSGDTTLTVVGNLTADPELRFTPSGVAVASFTVASTPRRYDKAVGEWVDGETLFMNCSAWRGLGENLAASVSRGDRLVVTGRLVARSYETNEGQKRTVFEMQAEDAAPSLLRATATVQKVLRSAPAPLAEPA